MGLLAVIGAWLIGLFVGLFKKKESKTENEGTDGYKAKTVSYLEKLSKAGTLHLKRTTENLWNGEITSMTEACLFLINLPEIRLTDIRHRHSAGRLSYKVNMQGKRELVLTCRTDMGKEGAVCSLLENGKEELRVRLALKETGMDKNRKNNVELNER